MSQSFTKQLPLDTDETLSANSDYVAPSQQAVKAYVDNYINLYGVTNGNSHDHLGGDGGTIMYTSISGTPTVREVLTSARTYYVATTGSDSNTGLASGTPFLTIQNAINVAAALDSSIYDITIQLATGTYSENLTLKAGVGAGRIIIQGNSSNISSTVITATSGNLITASSIPTVYALKDLRISGTAVAVGVVANYNSVVRINNIEVFTGISQHLSANNGSAIIADGNYYISGGGVSHWVVSNGTIVVQSRTITLIGTLAFSTSFANAIRNGVMTLTNDTFASGTATGTRYTASLNSVIDVNGGGASYLPGNVAGTTATGGQYA